MINNQLIITLITIGVLIVPFFLFHNNDQKVKLSEDKNQFNLPTVIFYFLNMTGLVTLISSVGTSDPFLNLRYRFGTLFGFSRIDLFLDTINNPDLLQRFINTIQIDFFQVSVGIVIIASSFLIEK